MYDHFDDGRLEFFLVSVDYDACAFKEPEKLQKSIITIE